MKKCEPNDFEYSRGANFSVSDLLMNILKINYYLFGSLTEKCVGSNMKSYVIILT